MKLSTIIGLKVVAIKGHRSEYVKSEIEPEYILFDDGETFIQVEEQDNYSYHDCNPYAREITVLQNKDRYNTILNYYEDYNTEL